MPRDDAAFDAAELFKHCRASLERNFVPSYIQVMDEIPKTASEKPQERFCLEAFEKHQERVHTDTETLRKQA